MLVDGIKIAAGSGFSIQMLDDARRGPQFPENPNVGDLWELTESNAGGIYEFTTEWILRNPAVSALSYDLSGTIFGKPEPSAKVLYTVAARSFYIQGALSGAIASALQAPVTVQDFSINLFRDTIPTYVGTMRFDAYAERGVFIPASSEPIRVQRGDVLTVTAPAEVDEIIADVSFTLCGYLDI